MTVRVPVAPAVLGWALDVGRADPDAVREKYAVDAWIAGERQPTLKQLQDFAGTTGVGFGYLLLPKPPEWELPIPDFREGFDGRRPPSADLIAVISLAESRQEWYRDYAIGMGVTDLDFVGSARDLDPDHAAAVIRHALAFEVDERPGSTTDVRKALLQGFEDLGGLTTVTSMVGNATNRLLDPDEFRGFALVDPIAPLVFVNANQTLNGQIFTLVHEFAHVWRGASGIGDADPGRDGTSDVERWCNAVASEILVPSEILAAEYAAVGDRDLSAMLDKLARRFVCGTLVVLQALHRSGIRVFTNFDDIYAAEVERLRGIQEARDEPSGGNYYNNQPFRIGERLSRAIVSSTLEGRTTIEEAMRLMSMRSLSTFDEYARQVVAG